MFRFVSFRFVLEYASSNDDHFFPVFLKTKKFHDTNTLSNLFSELLAGLFFFQLLFICLFCTFFVSQFFSFFLLFFVFFLFFFLQLTVLAWVLPTMTETCPSWSKDWLLLVCIVFFLANTVTSRSLSHHYFCCFVFVCLVVCSLCGITSSCMFYQNGFSHFGAPTVASASSPLLPLLSFLLLSLTSFLLPSPYYRCPFGCYLEHRPDSCLQVHDAQQVPTNESHQLKWEKERKQIRHALCCITCSSFLL